MKIFERKETNKQFKVIEDIENDLRNMDDNNFNYYFNDIKKNINKFF